MGKRKSTKVKRLAMKMFHKLHDGEVINTNDMINLTYLPSKSCYASKITDDIDTKLRYIQARVKESHESVIEHAYACILVILKQDEALELVKIANGLRYLNVETSTDDKYIYILIGGSIRGFKHLIRETLDQSNTIITTVKACLYSCSYRQLFVDLIEGGIMSDTFIDADESNSAEMISSYYSKYISDSYLVEILNIDPIQTIYNKVKKYGFCMEQCLSMASITILFKDMSRVITQQLTRHRNAITQESQRYVNYSGATFNSPASFKPDVYKGKNANITLDFGHGNEYQLGDHSLQELGDTLCQVYSQLVDQGLDKEDARGYLPQNCASTKVYMTFTYRSLIQFLKLRTDSHAQAEIRMYADIIDVAFKMYLEENVPSFSPDMYYYTIPRYMKTEDPNYMVNVIVDENIGEENVVIETEELDIPIDEKENAELLKSQMGYSRTTYASTREKDDKVAKKDI